MNTLIDPYTLGATLFIPLSHKDLSLILIRQKLTNVRTIVLDTEDGLSANALQHSLKNFQYLLQTLIKNDLIICFRPRDISVLEEVLTYKGIDKIDAFILPKFSLENAQEYLDIFRSNDHLQFMPSIEGDELFDINKLHKLKTALLPLKKQIILIRFGAQDLFSQLSLKRSCEETLYTLSSSALVIANLITTFKPAGFQISGAVYPCYKNSEILSLESSLDIKNGLIGKTVIHPSQIPIVEEQYKVDADEYRNAKLIIDSCDTIIANDKMMLEPHTDLNWATNIIKRYKIYGLKVKGVI